MRNEHEQKVALECLRLAAGAALQSTPASQAVVDRAVAYLAFVTGETQVVGEQKIDMILNTVHAIRGASTLEGLTARLNAEAAAAVR